jgi:2-desacetyl-2-hydroxyethyl bacteriochlorophyllide A dehydrogenase
MSQTRISHPAVIAHSPNQISLGEVELAELGPTQILIRTFYSGVSGGTDKWVISGRFEWGGFKFPLVPGYQRSGIVEAIGSEVKNFTVGQSVFATSCINYSNATSGWGAHSSIGLSEEFEVFDATGIPPARASFGVVAQVGFNAASRITAEPNSGVLVLGDGVIGLSASLAAQARGFSVLLVGRHNKKLSLIEKLGVATLNSQSNNTAALSNFDSIAVIDTVQNQDAFDGYSPYLPATWALETIGSRAGIGQVVFRGHSPDGMTAWADMAKIQKQELTVHFVSGWTKERISSTLELMRSGKLSLESIATEHSSDSKDVENLFQVISSGKQPGVASYINWSGSKI